MLAGLEQSTYFSRRLASAIVLVSAVLCLAWSHAAAQTPRASDSIAVDGPAWPEPQRTRDAIAADRARIDRTHREEGEAILALADAAMAGKTVPSDFGVEWQNEFVKARRGTFVPFTLTVDASKFNRPSALVYVRAARRGRD